MKNQMRLFVFLALVALLVRAQTPAEPNYEDFFFNLKFPLDNYRPLLNQVQVETLPPEEVDQSALSVRSLTFPAQETECSSIQEQGSPCPLKENGVKCIKCIMSQFVISCCCPLLFVIVKCKMADTIFCLCILYLMVRTRRSRAGRGSGRGRGSSSSGRGRGSSSSGRGRGSSSSGRGGGSRGSRAGRGSSIAGGGNRNNGGTRTA
uniref:Uncharacterized protein n=1 Tax=Myripristis murdjan TaxID=586833 RepID=A0A667ZJQ7_9TELE